MLPTILKLAKAQVALVFVTLFASVYFHQYLPTELQGYLEAASTKEVTAIESMMMMVLLMVSIAHLTAMVGLIYLKIWARTLLINTSFIVFPLFLFLGPQIEHPVVYVLDQLSVLLLGMILSLLIFNDSYQKAASKPHSA